MAPVRRRLSLLVVAAILSGLPVAAFAATRVVHIGLGGSKFVDEVSNTSTSTIAVGDTVQWTWSAGTHSTTSGTCAATCTADGKWDSGQHSSPFTFSHTATFATVGTYHYFCSVHGAMMQGNVVVVEPGPVPIIDTVDPGSGPAGGATAITITGTDFVDGATVTIGGVAATGVVVQGSTAIQAMTPALPPGTLADVTVTVQNPDTLSSTLLGGWFSDFTDVAGGDPFHDFVEQLVRNGVTAGCGSGAYCRDDSVTRAQMAVFLLKSKLGSGHVPPPCTGLVFDDVPCTGGVFDPWIEELASLQVTGGCQTVPVALYCPGNTVNRQQMAVFLLKAHLGSDHVPPACTGMVFDDVPCTGGPFDPWIEELASLGVTSGCQSVPVPLYCPTNPNTRGQMAVFLVKAFLLP
jgi:plastocyanin